MAGKEHDYGQQYQPKETQTAAGAEVILIPACIRFYIERLDDLLKLKRHVDRGDFPLSHYSASEEDTEGVPVLVEGQFKGLRWGVIRSIWGTRNILADMGYSNEADLVIKIDKKHSRVDEINRELQAERQEGKQ